MHFGLCQSVKGLFPRWGWLMCGGQRADRGCALPTAADYASNLAAHMQLAAYENNAFHVFVGVVSSHSGGSHAYAPPDRHAHHGHIAIAHMALLDGQPMVDAAWLYRAPLYQGSLQWSEDNLIAVAGGPSVTILSPSNLNGPRGHLTIQPSPGPVAMGCQPQDRDASLALKISCLEDASRQVTRGNPDSYQARPAAVRALSWSPMGASSTGGCLLAVLTDDQQVTAPRQRAPQQQCPRSLQDPAAQVPCM